MGPEVGDYVKAAYDFAAQQSGELSLRVGDVVKITDVIDANWLQGEATHSASGCFPSNFVEPVILPDVRMGQRVFVAIADYSAGQNGELELTKGDIILGTEYVDDNWWKGKIGPLRGLFPLNRVHELEVITEGPRARSASLRNRSASLKSRSDSIAATSEMVFARGLMDVVPQIEGELGFQTGDLITIKEVVDEDWFYGECHNKVGLVSTICVEILDDFADDSSQSASHLSQESAVRKVSSGERDSEQIMNEKPAHQNIEEPEASLPPENHYEPSNLQHSVSYTSENTRSHDAEVTPYAKTLYPFQAALPKELSFSENEIVTLIQHVDEDWIEGELDGKTGLFPASFVEIIVDCRYGYNNTTDGQDNDSGKGENVEMDKTQAEMCGDVENDREDRQTVSQNGHHEQTSEPLSASGERKHTDFRQQTSAGGGDNSSLALVLHSFLGEMQGDLSVLEGDTIEVLRILDENWLEARNDHGTQGLVPKNHVEVISAAPQSQSVRKPSTVLVKSGEVDAGHTTLAENEPASLEKKNTGEATPPSVHVQEDAGEATPPSVHITKDAEEATPLSVHVQPDAGEITLPSVPSSTQKDKAEVTSTNIESSVQQGAKEGPPNNIQSPKHHLTANINTSLPSNSVLKASPLHSTQSQHRPQHQSEMGSKPMLLPKPKIAPKPVIKPKPTLARKPLVSAHGPPKESGVAAHGVAPMEKQQKDSSNKEKVFSGLDPGLSLDNLVQLELEKAKSDGDRSRGSSIISEDKHSRSGSFSSTMSEEQPAMLLDSQKNCGDSSDLVTDNLHKIKQLTSQNTPADASSGWQCSVDPASQNATLTSSVNGTRTLSSPDLDTFFSPPTTKSPPPLNRSTSDVGATTPNQSPKSTPSKSNYRYSMPPARPAPPIPKGQIHRHSFVNQGFEHESEGHLVNVQVPDTSDTSHRAGRPSRAVPCPPPPYPAPTSSRNSQDLLGDLPVEKRVRRPPPRPTGPRIASAPPKTPLQPVRVEGSKPMPHRPVPAVPVIRRSAPVAPGSIQRQSSTGGTTPQQPSSVSGAAPPSRPPPRLQKSPSDLIKFHPEPGADEADDNSELVADLKKRIQENRDDIRKYEQSRQELETKLSGLEEASDKQQTEEHLQFIKQTLQGLKEEEKTLKGNLFSLRPREEKLEKAKLLAEQRETEERLRREEEERSAAQQRSKHRDKRQKVLQELMETEKDYLFDLQLCLATFFDSDSPVKPPPMVSVEYLFGNMEEIADVSQRLLTSLESAVNGKAFSDQIIGSTFMALADDMKHTYAPYCRHHDDVIAVINKHREVPEACQYYAAKVEGMRRRTNIFNVEAMLIKPVQRILKYPLLLRELFKCTEEDHPDKVAITNAILAMTNVATAINEYKRRKDLVFKYKRDSDETFAMKIAKLNFHSIKKKSSRIRGRLSTNLGFGSQVRDENFVQEEARFRAAEKAIKIVLRNVMAHNESLQKVISCQESLAMDIADYYGEKTCLEVAHYLTVHRRLLSHYKTLTDTVDDLVIVPLNKLVAALNGPNNIIIKRYDKLLDYSNLLGKDKDEEVVQAAKNNYEAMNAQLLDELPRLYQLIVKLIRHCMAAYIRAQRDFMDHALKEHCCLLEIVVGKKQQQLPSLLGGGDSMENFIVRHTAALDQISMLSFIPRGFNPKMDAFRLDRRSSSRSTFDPSKPPPFIQSSTQSDSQRAYLRQMYGADSLYQVTQTMAAVDLMDMAVSAGTLVGVIKDKDPMGGRQRWFVDDGANKGFVQSSILTKVNSTSPAGSMSSLATDDLDDVASFCSTSAGEEAENLPWMTGSQSAPNVYPEMTEVSQARGQSSSSDGEAHGYYVAEYPFSARSSNEVSLLQGQVVLLLSHHDLDGNREWWLVDAAGNTGYVPANYLRKM